MKVLHEEDVMIIHDDVLTASGGMPGLSGDKSLASALHRIYDHMTYNGLSDLYEIASLYAIAIAQGHTFVDGNKRTAMISMIDFLSLNGINFDAPDDELEQLMVDIAEKKINHEEITKWLRKYSNK